METQIKEKEIKITLKNILSSKLMPIKTKNRTDSIINPKISSSSGIYFLFDKSKELLYIGQTLNIRKRVTIHISKKKIYRDNYLIPDEIALITWLVTRNSPKRSILESFYHFLYDPPLNITKFNCTERQEGGTLFSQANVFMIQPE